MNDILFQFRCGLTPGVARNPYYGDLQAGISASVVILASLTRMLLGMLATLCRLIIVAHTHERYMISIPVRFDPGGRAQSQFS